MSLSRSPKGAVGRLDSYAHCPLGCVKETLLYSRASSILLISIKVIRLEPVCKTEVSLSKSPKGAVVRLAMHTVYWGVSKRPLRVPERPRFCELVSDASTSRTCWHVKYAKLRQLWKRLGYSITKLTPPILHTLSIREFQKDDFVLFQSQLNFVN